LFIYDGDCGVCARFVAFVTAHWRDEARAVTAQSLSDAALATLGLVRADTDKSAWWVDATERLESRSSAISSALRCCGGGLGLVGRILRLPLIASLADVGYLLVARYRSRLSFGGTPKCGL
jgi:predicted DCC family thiol-disulfide oxidoreductase YuxK